MYQGLVGVGARQVVVIHMWTKRRQELQTKFDYFRTKSENCQRVCTLLCLPYCLTAAILTCASSKYTSNIINDDSYHTITQLGTLNNWTVGFVAPFYKRIRCETYFHWCHHRFEETLGETAQLFWVNLSDISQKAHVWCTQGRKLW